MVAAAIIGSAVVGGVASAASSSAAAHAQAGAANNATGAQLSMFNTLNEQQKPFREAGYSSLGSIMGGFGLGPTSGGVDSGFFSHQFNANDLNANLAPNYAFSLKQGQGAVENFNNAASGLSGNTFKAMEDYTQNYAQNAYQQAFQNYSSNQTNIFNRLASIAGLGQTAGSNSATGASTFGGNIANSTMAAGNATAAGYMGVGNAVSGGANSIGQYYMLQSLLNNNGGGYATAAEAQANAIPSDRRIKQDIAVIGILPNGLTLYSFRYKPKYRDAWGHGRRVGVMADEVEIVRPDAVSLHRDGYKVVDYGRALQ